jgi:hypothetical protein
MAKISGLASCLLIFSIPGLLQAQSGSHVKALRIGPATSTGQAFFCVGPYSVLECATQIAVLQAVLRSYDTEELGKWNWIVVRSQDWTNLVSRLHLNPASPAFSHLGNHQTFLDEALLMPRSKRKLELIANWNIPFDQLLDFAVSHELGHALCQESDETKTERFSQRLRRHLANVCNRTKQPNVYSGSQRPLIGRTKIW